MTDELRRLPGRREYVLARPERYAGTVALVFGGGGWSTERTRAETRLDALLGPAGVAVAWGVTARTPIGIEMLSWGAGAGCCGRAGAEGVDDVAYSADVLADATAALGGVERAVAIGASNGAILAYSVAAAGLVDGVGIVAGCRLHPLPAGVRVVHVHGDADTLVPWSGGLVREGGGYACRPTLTEVGEIAGGAQVADERRGAQVWTYRWDGGRVTLHRRRGGGHVWSSDASGLIVAGLGLV